MYQELSFQSMDMPAQITAHSKEIEFMFSDIGRGLTEGEFFEIDGVKYYYRAPISGDNFTQKVIVNADAG
jgi:hypothetical protein